MSTWGISAAGAALHADALVWDNHGCLPMARERNRRFLPQLERYRDNGVDVVSLNIGYGQIPWDDHVRLIAAMRQWIKVHPDRYLLVETVADVHRARSEGLLAVTFDIEGAAPVQAELSLIGLFYDLGVRWMLIAYNLNNAIGGGCHDEDPGLTDLGREVLDEMARVGMVTCCSHTGYRTVLDVCAYSANPVILSHSNPLALWQHPRNVPDEAIRAVAATGGVVGINGIGIFLGDNDTRTETVVRHIDYVAELVGPEHVGIGLDYVFDHTELDIDLEEMPDTFPSGFGYEDGIDIVELHQLPEITEALLALGYGESVIRGILGENFLRVAERVWK